MMWILISAMLSAVDPSACVCVCVDGLAKTQCPTARAARANPSACDRDWECPIVRPESPRRSLSPAGRAHGELPQVELPPHLLCPEIRVWRDAWRSFDGVRVCDAA